MTYGDESQNYSYLWEQVLIGIRHKRNFRSAEMYYILIWVVK